MNTLAPADRLNPLDFAPLNARREAYRLSEPLDLRGPIFLAALGTLRARRARRVLARRRACAPARAGGGRPAAAATAAGRWQPSAAATLDAARASAQADDFATAVHARNAARLCDHRRRRSGRDQQRRACAASPCSSRNAPRWKRASRSALDIARDELAFFPLIYWPIVPGAAKPSPQALARIDAYMKQGGTVLFDTRDAIMAPPGPGGETRTPGMVALRTSCPRSTFPNSSRCRRTTC